MKKIIFLIALSYLVLGCKNNTSSKMYVDGLTTLPKGVACFQLLPKQAVVKFVDKYPIDLDVSDSLLYVIMAKSDTIIYIYDKNSGILKTKLGQVGYGPEDIISPEFLRNNYELKNESRDLSFYDLNSRKIFEIDNYYHISPYLDFVDEIYPSRSISISNNFWVGQRMAKNYPTMFQIYNSITGKLVQVDYYPKVKDMDKLFDKNYMYGLNIVSNTEKNRILAGMFFFDLIQIYDFNGKLIKEVSMTQGYDQEKALANLFNRNDYIGYPAIYSTNEFCYLRRDFIDGETRNVKKSQFVKMDWNGNIKAVYAIEEKLLGGFCVDNNILYCISQEINQGTEDEYYKILSFELES
ncbi:hypothetical protein K0F10_17180 [Bacteroides fragilis]|uniref:hypothetical protein n=1 Tax=Bacteroides TaxID=816 RepID=UPI0018997FDC|nr:MULTISPECIES: hypothetical protein [Bacteroides]MCE8626948.1 hypothetical protein [Bacteroides fragilis]MCE8701546.1 hypothetical protein [Bacteroides fragilis]MCE8706159.1 hypothetical protein [Bacteroides fragilis]MCE9328167.1 hypothetical protein [Bacteroides fragilis]MCE9449887.1 hypothetical protein [Bacteroides fragilis]